MNSSRFNLILLAALVSFSQSTRAETSIYDQNNWKLTIGGFVQADLISDSTRSFREIISNNPVARPDTADGQNARTQMTIRNSRLSFGVTAPAIDDWHTSGLLEFDLLGFDPAPGVASNTEAGLYNSPTFRVRHAFVQTGTEKFNILVGQSWELFGWQPFYFMPTVDIAPSPGMTFNRTVQMRESNYFSLGDSAVLQTSIALFRPPESDSGFPDLQAGARMEFKGRKSGFMTGGASGRKLESMSFAISGVLRQISAPTNGGSAGDVTTANGSAVSGNAFIPIISDDTSLSNTLSLIGSYTTGSGYGDQFIGWTGNGASPLNQSANKTAAATAITASRPINLDAGIGDYDARGNFNLEQITTYNLNLQYHLPNDMPDWVDVGMGVLQSNNINSLVGTNGLSSASKVTYDQARIYFANYFHEFTKQLRIGAEYDYIDTEYADGVLALDRRYQLSTYFTF